jgi:hypothetical protein
MIAALITLSIVLVLTVVLPVLSFRRASAAQEAVARLERRLAVLEDLAGLRGSRTLATAPEPSTLDPAETAPDANRIAPPGRPQGTPARLEARIGMRWMLYVGVATLVIGVGLFIRYAFVAQWVTEPFRVAIGVLTGALLLLSGRRFAAAGHAGFGHTLVGGGIATFYLAVYAALNLYGLVGSVTGFILLVSVTVLAGLQADRLRSQPLAMVAVVGGFSTPFLMSGGTPGQFTQLGLAALLIAATVYLANRRDWPVLNLVSFLLTGLTVLAWRARFYQPSAYLTTELFLTLYCALFFWVLHRMRGSTHAMARWVRLALWTTPVWYHAASLTILEDQWLALLVYLIAVTGVGVAVSVRWEAMWARLILWAAVAGPLLAWSDAQPSGSWLAPAVVTWLAIAGIHAASQIELLRRAPAQLHAADVLLIPANGFGLYFGLQAVMTPYYPALTGVLAALVALTHGGLAAVVRRIEPRAATHVLVVAVTLAVVAIAVQLDGAWLTMLWATEAVGLIWLGLGERRFWIRASGALLLGVSVLRLLAIQLAPVPAAYSVFVNQRATLGLCIVGLFALVAWLHARLTPDAVSHRRLAVATAVVGAHALMLVTLSTEIHAFWELRADTARFASSAEFARQMMLSATWGAYAAGLTAFGIRRRYAPVRYLALVVFGITVLKVFIVDFSQLDSIYRIVSSIALGLLLVGASYLYQSYGGRLGEAGERDEPAADVSP